MQAFHDHLASLRADTGMSLDKMSFDLAVKRKRNVPRGSIHNHERTDTLERAARLIADYAIVLGVDPTHLLRVAAGLEDVPHD